MTAVRMLLPLGFDEAMPVDDCSIHTSFVPLRSFLSRLSSPCRFALPVKVQSLLVALHARREGAHRTMRMVVDKLRMRLRAL